jgi:hypothetical protein
MNIMALICVELIENESSRKSETAAQGAESTTRGLLAHTFPSTEKRSSQI